MLTSTVFLGVLLIVSAQSESAPMTWEDIKEGQCLSVEEMQAISGVIEPNLYSSSSCEVEMASSGTRSEINDCDLLDSDYMWQAEYKKHDKAGVFFPFPVPCQQSVTAFDLEYRAYDTLFSDSEEDKCQDAVSEEKYYQKEIFKTKKFSAGQGDLYLPNPFQIFKYQSIPVGDERYEFCEETEVFMEYKGWGKLSASVEITDCQTREQKLCKNAKLKSSNKEDGASCVLIEKIENCDSK